MATFIIVTWTMIHGKTEQHDENLKKNMIHWRKNAKRLKLKSMRYYAQALGGDTYYYGRAMVFEFETLNDWQSFVDYLENDDKAYALKEKWLTNIDVKTLRIIEWQDRQRDAWLE